MPNGVMAALTGPVGDVGDSPLPGFSPGHRPPKCSCWPSGLQKRSMLPGGRALRASIHSRMLAAPGTTTQPARCSRYRGGWQDCSTSVLAAESSHARQSSASGSRSAAGARRRTSGPDGAGAAAVPVPATEDWVTTRTGAAPCGLVAFAGPAAAAAPDAAAVRDGAPAPATGEVRGLLVPAGRAGEAGGAERPPAMRRALGLPLPRSPAAWAAAAPAEDACTARPRAGCC